MPHPPPNQNDEDRYIEQLGAWARVNLTMPKDEFLSLEPVEFFALVEEWRLAQRRQRVNFAQICLTVASSSGAKTASGEPLSLAFFLGEKPVESVKAKRVNLRQQFINSLPAHFRPPVTNGHK